MRIHGRMSTIDAPVVPMRFASSAPMSRKTTFVFGVASPLSFIFLPASPNTRVTVQSYGGVIVICVADSILTQSVYVSPSYVTLPFALE